MNDLDSKEPLIEEIFHNLEKGKILAQVYLILIQNELFSRIDQIYKYKGKMISDGINISDIAFT